MAYRIEHARGALRAQTADYLEHHHYMRSSGGSGHMFAVVADHGAVCGAVLIGATASANCDRSIIADACLIGPAASQDAERSIAQPGVLIRQIKRSHLRDEVPTNDLCESQLLRHAMQHVTDAYDQTTLFVSYTDPAATDERTGRPLCGGCLLAASFFYIGDTTGKRTCVIDHRGRARSTRQGNVTLNCRTLPRAGDTFHGETITADWRIAPLPPARIWIAICTPTRMTRKQAKSAVRATWRQINPARKVAAKQWINHVAWRRAVQNGVVPLGEPTPQHMRPNDRFQPAWWLSATMTRTAAPVWMPLQWQTSMLKELDVTGETTAHRTYAPLAA